MTDHHEFHDGALEGFWLDGPAAHIHIRTISDERFTAVANGVAALSADGFKAGNIIFEVVTRESAEVTRQDLKDLYELGEGAAGESQRDRLMEKIHAQALRLLEINPSYGGRCLVLASSIEFVSRAAWIKQLFPCRLDVQSRDNIPTTPAE